MSCELAAVTWTATTSWSRRSTARAASTRPSAGAGTSVGRLLDLAGPLPDAQHVRVFSQTGYRWSFSIDDARELLLATRVGGEPLSHEHGAPLRLVAPGRRGYQWVKWIVRLELSADSDLLAPASTVWSSFTAEGRGS